MVIGVALLLIVVVIVIVLIIAAASTSSGHTPPAVARPRNPTTRDTTRPERDDSAALREDLVALEAAAVELPRGSPAAPVVAAAMRLAVQDRAAANLSAGVREALPAWEPVVDPASAESHVAAVESLVESLERNAVAVAGVEQLLLGAIGAAVDDPPDPEVLLALADVPEHLHGALTNLTVYAGGEFTADLGFAAHEAYIHALSSLVPGAEGSAEAYLRLGKGVAKLLVARGNPLGVVTPWMSHELLHGVEVLGQQAMESAAVAAAVEHAGQAVHALDGALGMDGVLGHIPVITALVSTVRETRLLQSEKTTINSAVKNLSLDLAGTGGGAVLGGKIGVGVGAILGLAPGAAAGGLIGAGIGAMAGRLTTNRMKASRLRGAETDLEQVREAYPEQMRSAAAELSTAVAGEADVARAGFRAEIGAAPRAEIRYRDELTSAADDLRTAIIAYVADVEAAIARARRLAAAGRLARVELGRAESALTATQAAVAADAEPASDIPLLRLCALAHAGPPVPPTGRLGMRYRESARHVAATVSRLTAEYAHELETWTERASTRFANATRELSAAIEPELRTFHDRQTVAVAELDGAVQRVVDERARLGR
jgi:hypothetical protein